MKRAQVAIFLVLGIFALTTVLLIMYLSTKDVPELSSGRDLQSDQKTIQLYADACLYRKSMETIKEWGEKGGRLSIQPPFNPQVVSTTLSPSGVDYFRHYVYLYNNGPMHTLDIEQDLKEALVDPETGIYDCVRHLPQFLAEQGWSSLSFTPENIEVAIAIENDKVIVGSHFPAIFSHEGYSFTLQDSRTEIPAKLRKMYEAGEQIKGLASSVDSGINNLNFGEARLYLEGIEGEPDDLLHPRTPDKRRDIQNTLLHGPLSRSALEAVLPESIVITQAEADPLSTDTLFYFVQISQTPELIGLKNNPVVLNFLIGIKIP